MKHSIRHKKLNVTSAHRKSLLMNLSNALLKHEQITTTLPKAKELRPFVEKLISLGKKGGLSARKKANSILHDSNNINKIFNVFADRYKKRNGGYTRIVKLGNRYGDNAPTAVIELIDRDINAKGKDSGPVIEKKSDDSEEDQS
jgi:large subunit ribosomal protein L17